MAGLITPAHALWRPGPSRRRRPADVIDTPGVSGVSNLPRKITVSGTTVDSATSGFFYDLTQATGASGSMTLAEANGQAAGALTEAGGGALVRGAAGPWQDGSTGATGDGTGYAKAAAGTFGDIATDDGFVVAVVKAGAASERIISKQSGANPGWWLWAAGGLVPTLALYRGGTTVSVAGPAAMVAGKTYIVCAGWNYSEGSANGAFLFSNAAAGSGVDPTAIGGSLSDTSAALHLMAHPAPAAEFTGTLYCAAMWHAADLFSAGATGAAEMQTLASELTDRVFGVYAAQARGAARTLSVTRTGTRYFDLHGFGQTKVSRELSINGTTVSPEFLYRGSDLATDGLSLPGVAGGDMTASAAFASAGAGPFADSTRGITFPGTRLFACVDAITGNVSTDDVLFEMVGTAQNALKNMLVKTDGNAGINIYWNTGPTLNFRIGDSGGYTNVTTAALTAGQLYHFLLVADRSGSAQWYVDGVASGAAVDISSRSGSSDNGSSLALGQASYYYTGTLYHLALWHSPAWLDTHLQATLAATRYREWFKGQGIHALGAGGHCVEEDADGARYVSVFGERENLCLQSEDLSTTWANTRSSETTNATEAPDGKTTADAIHEDTSSDTSHYIRQTGITLVSGTKYCVSGFVKEANRNGLRFQLSDGTSTFDVDFHSIANGSATAGHEGGTIISKGVIPGFRNDFARCWFTFEATDTSGELYLVILEADNDYTFTGLDQDSVYIWGMQVEAGTCPGPYIPTTTTSETKAAEVLTRPAGWWPGDAGTIECWVRKRGISALNYVFAATDGTTDDVMGIYLSSGIPIGYVRNGATTTASMNTGVDITDGEWHHLSLAWSPSHASIKVDGVMKGYDGAVSISGDIDRLHIGRREENDYILDGDIRVDPPHVLRIYPYARH